MRNDTAHNAVNTFFTGAAFPQPRFFLHPIRQMNGDHQNIIAGITPAVILFFQLAIVQRMASVPVIESFRPRAREK